MTIHPTAIVDPSARIGKNVSIGPYSVIGPKSVIGDHCRILSHAVIEYADLGESCVVYPHTTIGMEPQHLKYKGEDTRVKIGPRCQFREGVTVHRGTALDKSLTSIGSDGYFMALSHIAHDCVVGDRVTMANGAQLAGHVKIGSNVFISATVGIHQFTRVGDGAIVSGGAMVSLDVAPFCIAQGDRAVIRGLNVIGLRRQGVGRETMKNIRDAYRIVFQSGLPLAEALNELTPLSSDPYVKVFADFFREPKRGFTRPIKGATADEEAFA